MRALIFDEDKKLKLVKDYKKPVPLPGESLIKVQMAGICNTDLEITRGYMGFFGILGHEFVGMVEESENTRLIGKRVVGEINCPCGDCCLCRKGLGKHCPHRTTLGIAGRNGAFADYVTLPDVNLHILPDTVSSEEACFVEPLASAFEILESLSISPQDRILLIGDGKLALLMAQVLYRTGASLTVIGKHGDKLDIMTEITSENRDKKEAKRINLQDSDPKANKIKEGRAETSSPPLKTLLLEQVTAMEKEKSFFDLPFDIVVEASGNREGFALAEGWVRPRGTILQKSTYADNLDFNISMLVVNEIRLIGSRCGPFIPAIKALTNRSIQVKPIISRIFDMEQGVEAFNYALTPGILKVLLRF